MDIRGSHNRWGRKVRVLSVGGPVWELGTDQLSSPSKAEANESGNTRSALSVVAVVVDSFHYLHGSSEDYWLVRTHWRRIKSRCVSSTSLPYRLVLTN